MNTYYNPVRTIEGKGCIQELPDVIRKAVSRETPILLLSYDESVFEGEPFKSLLKSREFRIHPLCFQASNPTIDQLYDTWKKTEPYSIGLVIAVGGGSVMDIGKSLCCIYGQKILSVEELRDKIVEKNYSHPKAKWIGVPTTAGTGSEVTCWATIWDPKKNAKRSVESQENYAYSAVVDSDLASGMPVSLSVSSALDAAAHGVESYWAKGSNLVSKGVALEAVKKIMGAMEGLLENKTEAHERMAEGSMLAGLAFSNTKTTACHSISYPLTMHYGIPHGVAVSMLLAPVLKMNLEKTEEPERLLDALGVESPDALKEKIQDIFKRASIPGTLKGWHIEYERIPELARLGMTKGRADNNPVELTCEKIEELLKSIYE